jgi:3-polyprenyl-4-hydroxybenzoate decarboxylase
MTNRGIGQMVSKISHKWKRGSLSFSKVVIVSCSMSTLMG